MLLGDLAPESATLPSPNHFWRLVFYLSMWICMCVHMCGSACRDQKRLWSPLKLELQVAVNLPICVLRLKSSRRALSSPRVISKVPPNRIFDTHLLKLVPQWAILKQKKNHCGYYVTITRGNKTWGGFSNLSMQITEQHKTSKGLKQSWVAWTESHHGGSGGKSLWLAIRTYLQCHI